MEKERMSIRNARIRVKKDGEHYITEAEWRRYVIKGRYNPDATFLEFDKEEEVKDTTPKWKAKKEILNKGD